MTSWRELEADLDAIAARGKAIRLWWRDDDAGRDHAALDRLLELAERRDLPLALAVVPLWLEAPAQARIAASAQATVLQHGYRPCQSCAGRAADRSSSAARDSAAIVAELSRGQAALLDAFGATFLAVLVPPWNRLDRELIARLDRLRLLRPVDLRPARCSRARGRPAPGQRPSRSDRLARRPAVRRRGRRARAA